MGFFRGLAGKALSGLANYYSGGLAGKVGNLIKSHSGLIGKVAGDIGRSVVPSKVRNAISSITDSALKLVPEGEVKSTLSKINDAAQGRDKNLSNTRTNLYKSSDSRIASGEGTIYGSSTAPINRSELTLNIREAPPIRKQRKSQKLMKKKRSKR